MNDWLELMIALSVAGSVVVACILLLDPFIQKGFSAKWHYLLRKVAIFFYLVPVLFIVQRITFYSQEPLTDLKAMQTSYWGDIIPKQYIPIELAIALLSIWTVGVVAFGGWHVYCHRKFTKEMKRNNLPIPNDSEVYKLLNAHKKTMRIRRDVQLAYNNQIASPAIIGLRKPTILLPIGKMSLTELNMVLHHELIHFKRKDLWIKIVMLAASSLHWFNPFVYILRKEVYIWSELSCDEEVVVDMSYAERKRYGEMILNMLEDSFTELTSYSAFLSGNKKNLKKRLTMLVHVKTMKKLIMVIATTIIISIGAIGTTASALASESTPVVNPIEAKETIFDPDNQKVEVILTDSF